MLSSLFPWRFRALSFAFAASAALFVTRQVGAQSPSTPAVPVPQPVAPETLPSMPAATTPPTAQSVPVPADAPQQPTPGQQNPAQPYQDPLEKPITIAPGQPAPVQIAPPAPVVSLPSIPTDYVETTVVHTDHLGSTYINDDDVIYPMALRLYSLGYLDSAFISMRPWTRRGLLHMLEKTAEAIQSDGNSEAMDLYAKLLRAVSAEVPGPTGTLSSASTRGQVYGLETVYTRLMGISGLTLRDSYHLGQTIVNDYGRPYEPGFNNITGFSTVNEAGRFSFYLRGEYQHAPSAAGYNPQLSSYFSSVDQITFAPPNDPQATIPSGPLAAANPFRLQEATVSFHVLGHEISGGKSDAWLGPAAGGAMAWSNNAENIYSFRINRVEPFNVPYFSRVFGPLRYDFFVGDLKGHTYFNSPWVHSEMFSLRPTTNFEFTFQRTVIWGGEGHVPVTFGTFFRSFFSLSDTEGSYATKNSRNDPGARFSDFSFSWRLPYLRKYVTLYTDSIAHDDVTPISAPRRAAYRPGIYIAQFPGLRKLDFRAEAASTDTSTLRSLGGTFNYFEGLQPQGYTNKGFIMGDWIGREAKGGQAWLTYHLSANEFVQLEYLNKKTPKDFIAGGTTQNQFKVDVVKRLRPDIELDAWFQYEHWDAPVYQATHQNDTVTAVQVKFYPKLRTSPRLDGK